MKRFLIGLAALASVAPAATDAHANALRPCVKGKFQCARIKVPFDYDNPSGRKFSIPITRIVAKQPKRRIGTIFINYGGPGAGAVEATQANANTLFKAYRKRFDIVAFDPRGAGDSKPGLNCKVDQERVGLYRHPYFTPTTYDRTAALTKAKRYADACTRRNADVVTHVSTANVARDMESVRNALGVKKVTYFGFSYGTFLGTTYAHLFPQSLRAIVLDGPVDANAYISNPIGDLDEQTAGFEDALDRYFAACSRAKRACRWTGGRSPRAAYDRLVARANANPLKVKHPKLTKGSRRRVDGDALNFAVAGDLYAKQLWPEISASLLAASKGDGSPLRLLTDESYGRRKDGSYTPDGDRYFLIGATEQQYPREPEPYEAAGANAYANTRDFIFNTGFTILDYSQFTLRDADAYLGPFDLPASAPTPLVVGTTHDPATPYPGAKNLVATLGRAGFLTMRGDGHTAYGGNSKCIDKAVNAYVIHKRLPAEGKTCRQHVPFPPKKTAKTSALSATVPAVDIIPHRGR